MLVIDLEDASYGPDAAMMEEEAEKELQEMKDAQVEEH